MLKHLKGARILADCETGELHMDLGDGNCKPIGGAGAGGGGCDLVVYGENSDVTLHSGTFDAVLNKMKNHEVPNIAYMSIASEDDGGFGRLDFERINSIRYTGSYLLVKVAEPSDEIGFSLYPDNTVQYYKYED